MTRTIHGETVAGVEVDAKTRCAHYRGELDIIAIRFKCCDRWYPCFECHRETVGHEPMVWPAGESDTRAVLCGACGYQLTVGEYLACNAACPVCMSGFNPGCANHHHLYFE